MSSTLGEFVWKRGALALFVLRDEEKSMSSTTTMNHNDKDKSKRIWNIVLNRNIVLDNNKFLYDRSKVEYPEESLEYLRHEPQSYVRGTNARVHVGPYLHFPECMPK